MNYAGRHETTDRRDSHTLADRQALTPLCFAYGLCYAPSMRMALSQGWLDACVMSASRFTAQDDMERLLDALIGAKAWLSERSGA